MFINTIVGKRQSGKTTALVNLAYDFARANSRSRVLVVTESNAEVEHMTNLMKERAANCTALSKRILLFNGSEVFFVAAIHGHTITKGRSIDQAYIDINQMSMAKVDELEASIIPCLSPEGRLWEAYNID